VQNRKPFAVLGDRGHIDIGRQRPGKRVQTRHGVLHAAPFVQPDRLSGAVAAALLRAAFPVCIEGGYLVTLATQSAADGSIGLRAPLSGIANDICIS